MWSAIRRLSFRDDWCEIPFTFITPVEFTLYVESAIRRSIHWPCQTESGMELSWRRTNEDFQTDVLLMLQNGSIRRIVSSLVMAVWLVCPAFGRLARRFLPGDAGWFSTDIVVAQEMEKLDLFQVIDVWKGSSSPGDLVRIPGMAEWQRSDKRMADDTGEQLITITTHQVLLCLKRDSIRATESKQIVWSPATFWDTWKTSFAWLQDGKQYVVRAEHIRDAARNITPDGGERE